MEKKKDWTSASIKRLKPYSSRSATQTATPGASSPDTNTNNALLSLLRFSLTFVSFKYYSYPSRDHTT